MCCILRYKQQGGLNAYWQTLSVHEAGVDVAAVTVHNLRPDTTYRFRVMWRSLHDDEAHFSNVVIAHTAGSRLHCGCLAQLIVLSTGILMKFVIVSRYG